VLVAIDTDSDHEVLAQSLADAVRRLVTNDRHWRITCATVADPSPAADEETLPELARSLHTRHLMALHHWARTLELPPEQLRFAVLPASDAAAAITDYARAHHVDHIVMGARGSSALRRFLGSVSARVVAEAPCSVTVVRMTTPDGSGR
jgi:nucleotide-binding universal stress UspA family protein